MRMGCFPLIKGNAMYVESTDQAKQRRHAISAMARMVDGAGLRGVLPCGHRPECAEAKEQWRNSQDELRWLSEQLLTIQESERQRIAADLHDGLGQSLTLIKLSLEETSRLLADGEIKESAEFLERMKLKIRDAIGEVRRVSMDLRPSTLDDLGILATLSWFFREFEAACRNVRVERDISIQEKCVPVPLKITIFRIIQEATSNIVKHANASCIRVSFKQADDVIDLVIEDDGKGFDLGGTRNYCPLDKGLGLVSMRERAVHSGGSYEIHSAPGQGTRISVRWPLDQAAGTI